MSRRRVGRHAASARLLLASTFFAACASDAPLGPIAEATVHDQANSSVRGDVDLPGYIWGGINSSRSILEWYVSSGLGSPGSGIEWVIEAETLDVIGGAEFDEVLDATLLMDRVTASGGHISIPYTAHVVATIYYRFWLPDAAMPTEATHQMPITFESSVNLGALPSDVSNAKDFRAWLLEELNDLGTHYPHGLALYIRINEDYLPEQVMP